MRRSAAEYVERSSGTDGTRDEEEEEEDEEEEANKDDEGEGEDEDETEEESSVGGRMWTSLEAEKCTLRPAISLYFNLNLNLLIFILILCEV